MCPEWQWPGDEQSLKQREKRGREAKSEGKGEKATREKGFEQIEQKEEGLWSGKHGQEGENGEKSSETGFFFQPGSFREAPGFSLIFFPPLFLLTLLLR